MRPLEKAGYLAHARTPGFQKRIEGSLEIIERGYDACPTAYISHSLGKDSAVMAHLVLSVLCVPARFLRWEGETENLDNYDEVIGEWSERFSLMINQIRLSRYSLSSADLERWDALRGESLGSLVGLREEESYGRKTTLRHHGAVYESRAGIWRICPLAKWSSRDIAAYITLHKLPLLKSYELEGMEHRTSARVPRAANHIRQKALERVRAHNPAGYNVLLAKFPELEGLL